MTIYDFTKLTDEAIHRSNALSTYLQQQIKRHHGMISFAAFMQAALYHPDWGYYNTNTFDLGARGDFTTAPLISPLFAKCFAQQCATLFAVLKSKNILEIGAGTGHFACDFLIEMERLGTLPEHYFIYEISPTLRTKQQALVNAICPRFLSRCSWLSALPENFGGIVIANEVLDALPVHCFYVDEQDIKERSVVWNGNEFTWQLHTSSNAEFIAKTAAIRETYALYPGYQSEINLALPSFIADIAKSMVQGIVLLADYGYGRCEYYHPERKQGSLTCFYKHQRHDDALRWPGLSDITAHVDFTSVIEAAIDEGFSLAGFTSQAAFLLSTGLVELTEELQQGLNPVEEFKLHQDIKRLTMPTEMGDRVKIMALTKDLTLDGQTLIGFQFQDRSRDL